MDFQLRRPVRLRVDIPVTITTVLETFEATIIDMSEEGALVTGCGLASGTRFQIGYFGQIHYARCRWAEIDRMGVAFSFPLTDGPLYERLLFARTSGAFDCSSEATAFTPAQRGGPGIIRTFGRRAN